MYLKKALEKKYLDEVHLWERCRNEKDRAWVKSLETDSIKVYNSDDKFSNIYKYYQDSDDLFLKLDDDIVYVNIDEIPDIFKFLQQQPDNLMFVSPICINNPTHYNLTNIPALLGHNCSSVVDTMCDVDYLKKAHYFFTNHFDKVRATIFNPLINTPYQAMGLRSPKTQYNTCGHSIGCAWGIEYQGYIPVNTIFFKKQLCKYLTDNNYGNDDEPYLNFPKLDKKYFNMVYNSVFGSHLSYGGQDINLGDDIKEIIDSYRTLATLVLK